MLLIYPSEPLYEMILPGIPTTTALSGISFVTTQFAPIDTLFPINILPIILAPGPIYTSFPIVG